MTTHLEVSRTAKIVAMFHQKIESGEIPPGGRLPSEPTLQEQFNVSRTTVREAYARLISSGRVVKRAQQGYFVRPVLPITWPMTRRDSRAVTTSSPVDPWLTVVQDAGYHGEQHIQVRIVSGDEPLRGGVLSDVMRDADDRPITRAVLRDRVRIIKGVPQEIARSYYAWDIAADTPIMDAADIQPSTYHLLAQAGHEQVAATDTVCARMPTPIECHVLDIEGILPVLDLQHVVRFAPTGRVLLVRRSVYVGGPDKEFTWEFEQ